MNIVRFKNHKQETVLGVLEDTTVFHLTDLLPSEQQSLPVLYQMAKQKGITVSELLNQLDFRRKAETSALRDVQLLTPVEALEVWASGVTYEKSRSARNSEMKEQLAAATVYDKVYDAVRPELFFKSTAARTVPPGKAVCIRSDSSWQIPEPELALVLSSEGDIIGFTAGNDMSSRDIEGENPLYLPQAKMWKQSCSFGPSIRLADSVTDPYDFDVTCTISRNGSQVFQGSASARQLKRTYDELIEHLTRDNILFDGTVLFTGTCIIPPDAFTLAEGDDIEIHISGIGTLKNTVSLTTTKTNESVLN